MNNYLSKLKSVSENRAEQMKIVKEIRGKASGGDSSAIVAECILQLEGKLLEANTKNAIKTLISMVQETMNIEAASIVGESYLDGLYGVKQDTKRAERYLRISANGGDSNSAYRLGLIYFHGDSFNRDLKEAVRWFEVATEGEHHEASVLLGESYLSGGIGVFGEIVGRNINEGLRLLRAAADKGSQKASLLLAKHYLKEVLYYSRKSDPQNSEIKLIETAASDIEWLIE